MGDRDNPIKFGPEWLRNLAGERSTASQGGNNSQSTGPAGGTGPSTRRGGGGAGDSFAGSSASQSSNGTVGVRVQLANLRYGREEMLALYEAAADPPHELTGQDLLYQPRGKPPFALSTSFEDEMRESLRSSTHTGGIPGERFSLGRGMGRGLASVPDNPRPRFRATGSTVLSRPSGEPPEAGTRPQLTQRNPRYQASDNKPVYFPTYVGSSNNMFRSKRQNNTTSTNWRSSQTRDGGEEWRSSEPGRPRTGQDRERDRDRPGDRPQSGSNRRSMSDHNDETIPEWAFANAEACGGTFDSSGAFHGYSSDDSSLPQKQDNEFSLSRSRTHNNIMRLKTVEEGSEEWWASEKAKKLSPKRFDAGDIKFKQGAGILDGPLNTMSQNSKSNTNREEQYEEPQKDSPPTSPELPSREPYEEAYNNKKSYNKQQFSESKPFDSMMRQDISVEEAHSSSANDQRGNFKSVMITPNNSLRTKHQNIVSSANETTANRAQGLMSMKAFALQGQKETDHHQQQTFEEKIIDDFLDMPLESHDIGNAVLMGPSSSSLSNNSLPPMHDRGLRDLTLQGSNIPNQTINNVQNMGNLGMQSSGLPQGVPNVGLNNPSMNQHVMSQMEFASNNSMGMPLQVPQGMMQNAGLSNHGMEGASMQRSGLPGFQTGGIPMGSSNVSNNSLFMGKNSGGVAQGDIPMPGHTGQGSMFPMHGLQHSGSQGAFSATVFNNLMQQSSQPPPAPNPPLANPLADQWYYEDPDKNTQGPFSSREMYTWYRAGFFTPSLMVRRACEREMRPLGSYGPLVPFVQMDVMPPFPMSGFESRAPMNQSGLGLGVINTSNNDKPIPMPPSAQNAMRNSLQSPMQSSVQTPTMPSVLPSSAQSPRPNAMLSPIQVIQNAIINQNIIQSSIPPLQANMQSAPQNGMQVFGNVGLNRNAALGQQNMFDSLWGQGSAQDVRWMHSNPPIASRVNNLPMYFWEPSAINSTSLLPEDITKEMKTEDQILAQLRAAQTISQSNATHTQPDLKPATSSATQMDAFSSPITATYFEELHKIIHKDTTPSTPASSKESSVEQTETQPVKLEKPTSKSEQTSMEPNNTKLQQTNSTKTESKPAKQTKAESEKAAKNKENNSKSKNKKKEEKKEDGDSKIKEDDNNKTDQKRSVESSPVKSKKEEKSNKKDLEKEKKEWIKEGFTIVKGSEKGVTKDTKKKSEEAKQIEEAERKRKEEEKLAAEEERKRKQTEHKKNQEQTQPQPSSQKQAAESAMKKAPWSASQAQQATSKDGLTLAEIQRLEREKKLEQMREQQQMMQIIAQQQAAALAREQEMQANLAWAKKKAATPVTSPSFAEIQITVGKVQAEQVSRKQASVAVVSPPAEEERPPAVNHTPWGNAQNGESPPWPTSGFWDSPVPQPPPPKAPEPKQQETKPEAPKPSKKKTPASSNTTAGQNAAGSAAFAKKVTTPAVEFETWCTTTLKSWSTKIDVPTFIGFLKDIESPYEVKDYVRCYLGETKDSGDFARQFLERRSKLLRVGMVTPSDDLCSPAMAVNPRSNSQSDYQEVKGKGKKPKKNKMLKVDARFLGFSATASEDRINVGDIDTV